MRRRLIVDDAPREISSRSTSDRCRRDRRRGCGRTPPVDSTRAQIDAPVRPSCRPIDRVGSPACHRSRTSTRSASLNLPTTTSSNERQTLTDRMLRSPPETTADMGASTKGRVTPSFAVIWEGDAIVRGDLDGGWHC